MKGIRRIIPCLDVRDGKTTKGIKFKDNVDIGDPLEMAVHYYKSGADELVVYDITASHEKRSIFAGLVREIAAGISIPLVVGGGISELEDMKVLLGEGAKKLSINSAAVKNPSLIEKGALSFGSESILAAIDVKQVERSEKIPSGYEIVINGGRLFTGLDALLWAKRLEDMGAGELCLNSIDADGTKDGYELKLTAMIAEALSIPVIASGGGGKPEHLVDVLTKGRADAALVASMLHYGDYSISEIKAELDKAGIKVSLS